MTLSQVCLSTTHACVWPELIVFSGTVFSQFSQYSGCGARVALELKLWWLNFVLVQQVATLSLLSTLLRFLRPLKPTVLTGLLQVNRKINVRIIGKARGTGLKYNLKSTTVFSLLSLPDGRKKRIRMACDRIFSSDKVRTGRFTKAGITAVLLCSPVLA